MITELPRRRVRARPALLFLAGLFWTLAIGATVGAVWGVAWLLRAPS